MKKPTDHEILRTMLRYGGGFASAFARAGFCADESNLNRLKTAFPDLWEEFAQACWYEPPLEARTAIKEP